MIARKVAGLAVAGLLGGVVLQGCMESPTAASLDVADARSQGQREVDRVRRAVSEQFLKASAEVAEARRRAQRTAVEGEREIALAQARADYDVAIKGCEALGGEARRACQQVAQRRFEQARDAAVRIEYAYLD
jgi:hypothetical protein